MLMANLSLPMYIKQRQAYMQLISLISYSGCKDMNKQAIYDRNDHLTALSTILMPATLGNTVYAPLMQWVRNIQFCIPD